MSGLTPLKHGRTCEFMLFVERIFYYMEQDDGGGNSYADKMRINMGKNTFYNDFSDVLRWASCPSIT